MTLRHQPPRELYSRCFDVGATPTMERLEEEAVEVITLIMSGGSNYSDAPDRGCNLLKQCRRFLSSLDETRNAEERTK